MKQLFTVVCDDQNSFLKLLPVKKNPLTMKEIVRFINNLCPLIIEDMPQIRNSLHNLKNLQILANTKANVVKLGLKTLSYRKEIWNLPAGVIKESLKL